MKKLERMLLINWHYISKEMIEFSNINFLTGKNGSGKSTIIDALQLLLLGDTRGNFFNKAANDRTERTLEGYLRGEIGDDGDTGYKYLRSGKFSSYIVCEFYDTVTRKNFCIGVVFDVYNESGFEHKFFMFNGSIPENEFIGENNIPFSFAELKSFLTRKYGNKNLEICTSNTQYQVAVRGKFGGLNQKFFNLFKKAVTFTPINDIEKFIVEYVCDVKNQIDITSMQENIRQYNSLLKQVDVMNTQKNQLQEIENTYNGYLDECMKQREAQYLIWRAEKQQLIDEYENLQKQVQDDKDGKVSLEETTTQLEKTKGEIEKEISDLTVTRANSDIKIKSDKITAKIQEIDSKLNNISEKASKNIATLRNYTLRWNASISKLESAKDKVNYQNINNTRDLIKYIDSINENIFNELDINAITETRNNISDLINWGTSTYFDKKYEIDNKKQTREVLIQDIEKLKNGINPYDSQFINFKAMLEARLKEKFCKDIEVSILADLLEIKDARWQNAIEGYLNTQKKYLIIDPQYFEEASKIYRELARENEKIHSFGIVDIEKIRKDNASNALENSLATEVITENELARTYVDYLLGRVIKCETIEELRSHKQAITSDCMLYQGYVLRKIDPKFYKYPVIGKKALEQQKQIKENELAKLEDDINNFETVINAVDSIRKMANFGEEFLPGLEEDIIEAKKKSEYDEEKQKLQQELDSMDLFWLNTISEKIKEKEVEKTKIEQQIKDNSLKLGILSEAIKNIEEERLPRISLSIEEKTNKINDFYDVEWQQNVGEQKYDIQSLKKTAERIAESYSNIIKGIIKRKDQLHAELIDKRSDFNTKYQYAYNIQDASNEEFSKHLKKLEEVVLPEYTEKIKDSRQKAYEQFRIEFLDKLKSNIDEVKKQIKELNSALGEHRFGTDSYSFKVSPKQEYKRFYDMLQDDLLLGDWAIGQEQFNQKYSQEIKELFEKITTTDVNNNSISSEEYEKNIKEYTDYRTYLNFDLIVKDKLGNEQRLSKTLLKKSGGETQTPFYISILASFAQLYRTKSNDNTIRLIVFDEAFSKMDSERIEESIKLLKKIQFQAIFAAPPEKLQDIQALVDSTLLVLNPEEHEIVVKKYTNKEE